MLSHLFGSPLPILVVLAVIAYLLIDRRFVGLLPDYTRPFRHGRRITRLAQEIKFNPANATAQLELGTLYLERGDVRHALPMLEKARERMEDSARVLFLLGATYRRLDREGEAKEALTQAVALNPKIGYGEPYFHLLAIALRGKVRVDGTTAELKERIMTYGSPEVYYRAGRVLLAGGDRDGAKDMFQEAIENYRAAPKGFRRIHRRWAAAAKIALFPL
jgi:tetratricopeptide (TPR) repeat protein